MKIEWRYFGGMFPRLRPHLLPDDGAVTAVNTFLHRQSVGALRQPLAVVTPAKVGVKKSIYRFGQALDSDTQYWFHWLNDTDVTAGLVPDDPAEFTVYTEAGQPPKFTDNSIALASTSYPHASYLLGLPAPTSCSVAVTGTPLDPDVEPTRTLVVYTFVQTLSGVQQEGPPSPASAAVDWNSGQAINVTLMDGPPSGAYNVTAKRLYLALTDANGVATFRFWAEVAAGTANYSATPDAVVIGASEALAEPTLLAPPSNLFGIGAHPGRFLYGFSGKNVCRSEIERAHGWPAAYQDPLPHPIVGGAIVGSSIVVCTTSWTYLAQGGDPLNFTFTKIELHQPCVSKRSIVAGDGGVFYASSDGLVLVSAGGEASIITRDMLTAEQWQAYKPSSFTSAFHDGQYIAFYDTGSQQGALVFDFNRKQFYTSTVFATAVYSEPKRNALFLQVGNDIVKWDSSASRLTATWRSKEVITGPTTFCAARVQADAYPVTLAVYGDGVLRHSVAVANDLPLPLPGEYRARRWQIEVSGTNEVSQVALANDMHELVQG